MKKGRRKLAFIIAVIFLLATCSSFRIRTEAEGAAEKEMDFSSCELLVGTGDPSILTEGTEVLSSYKNVYLIRYETSEQTQEAYRYYRKCADFVDINISLSVSEKEPASEEEHPELTSSITRGEVPDSMLMGMDTSIQVPDKTIALIDTGVNDEGTVARTSVFGDDGRDENGHGTKMFRFMKEEYPEASILSIKAMGADGRGQVSDIYAAIQYAMELKVDVINLSISAYYAPGSEAIEQAVSEAVGRGIVVVGSAGNGGNNAAYTIPGGISEATIVGACDAKGVRRVSSNYGTTVDHYLVAESTSEAAARMSAILARNDGQFVVMTNNPANGHTEGTPYVKRIVRDGNTVLFGYYDAKGNYVDSDYMIPVRAGGKDYSMNSLCVRFDWSPGNDDYEFDVKTPVEITNKKSRRLIYRAIHILDYDVAHRVVCYWFGQKASGAISGQDMNEGNDSDYMKNYGSTSISNPIFHGTVDEFIEEYTGADAEIPVDVEFHAYYLDTDAAKPAGYPAYQDFITWKEKETGEKNYYIAVKKVDPNGTPIVGVTFDVAVNGDKTSLLHMVTNSNGIATLNLGKYFSKPYVAIRETDDWDGAEEFQIDTRWYGKKEARGDVGVYTSVAEARSHVTEVRHLRENKREPVYVCVRKRSANSEITENNPNYSLEDARYKVYKSEEDAKEALQTRDFSKADGTLKTDADGETGLMDVTSLMELNSKGRLRPSGTRVYLVESKAPKGYQMSNKVSNVIVYPNNTKDNPALIEVSDTPVTEVLYLGIRKVSDGDTEHYLSGATFHLTYYPEDVSKNYTYKELTEKNVERTRDFWLTTEKTTLNKQEYIGVVLKEKLPLGYVTIEEVDAPDGYLLPGEDGKAYAGGKKAPVRMTFALVTSGNTTTGFSSGGARLITDDGRRSTTLPEDAVTPNEIVYADARVRGDLEIQKYCETGDTPWEGAVFQIENVETHERHVIVTDKNGYAGTSADYQKHNRNTGYYDNGRSYDGTKAGVWFRENPSDPVGADATPDNSRGALIEGEYIITEIDAAGLQKEEPVRIYVGKEAKRNADGTVEWTDPEDGNPNGRVYRIFDPGRTDGAEAVTDRKLPQFKTRALTTDPEGTEEASQVTLPKDGVTLYDVVDLSDLRTDTDYTLVGRVMQKEEDGTLSPLLKADGTAAEGRTTFSTKTGYETSRYEAAVTQVVKFEDLDLTRYAGRELVIYERLYLGTETEGENVLTHYPDSNNDTVTFPLIHEDPEDADQTIKVQSDRTPAIVGTTLLDKETRGHISYPDQNITLIDLVEYSGTEFRESGIDEPYVIEGKLMDRETGAPILDENGKEICGRTEIYPGRDGSGLAEVKYEFHGKLLMLAGKSVVCYEYLYEKPGGKKIAEHADLKDKDQTVSFPKIGTSAGKTRVKRIEEYEQEITVTDTVSFRNLPADKAETYIIRGWLVDQDGKPVKINGKEIRAEKEFTTGKSNGTVDVVFPSFTFLLPENEKEVEFTYVVFEEVYLKTIDAKTGDPMEVLVGVHKDVKDQEQTVTGRLEREERVKHEERPKDEPDVPEDDGPYPSDDHERPGEEDRVGDDQPRTGDQVPLTILWCVLIIAAAGLGTTLFLEYRNTDDEK